MPLTYGFRHRGIDIIRVYSSDNIRMFRGLLSIFITYLRGSTVKEMGKIEIFKKTFFLLNICSIIISQPIVKIWV